jgi:16S rRNA processing protein RimM
MNNQSSLIEVAKIGRLVGLKGELKLHLECDFPEQFKKGRAFTTQKGEQLEIFSYNPKSSLISFVGYQDRDLAAKLVNAVLFTTKERSLEACALKEGEFFWFDVIGSNVIDNDGTLLGEVDEIERIGTTDYLMVLTSQALSDKGYVKTFLIPYIDRYVVRFDQEKHEVHTQDALGILENS